MEESEEKNKMEEGEVLNKEEARNILAAVSFPPNNDDEYLSSVALVLARDKKAVRRKHVRSEGDSIEKFHSSIIEISRVWRGYICRKNLHTLFEQKDAKVQRKPKPVHIELVEENNDPKVSSVLLHIEDSAKTLTEKTESINTFSVDQSNLQKSDSFINQEISLTDTSHPTPKPITPPVKRKIISNKSEAASIIQRAWRRHIDMQVFRYYRDLINFRGQGDPGLMLRCINPNEARLLDAAAGVHVRFRLAGEKFPPNIYYKIYTHRPIIDMCANSPKDYTQPDSKTATAKQKHNKHLSLNAVGNKKGWYEREENNGWRLVSDRLIYTSMDPVTWETARKKVEFHHVKLQRRADVDKKRRRRKISWMKKMYKEGMLRAREADEETNDLVDKAARGLVNTVARQGADAVMDWEVDELLQWTTALNFDDYLEGWKESATSNVSEREVANIKHAMAHVGATPGDPSSAAVGVAFDPFSLTRASSMGAQHTPIAPAPSAQVDRIATNSGISEAFMKTADVASFRVNAPSSGDDFKEKNRQLEGMAR